MNIPTIIALIVVATLVVLVVRILVKSGGSTCPSCSGCSGSACHKSEQREVGCLHCHSEHGADATMQCSKCKSAADEGLDTTCPCCKKGV